MVLSPELDVTVATGLTAALAAVQSDTFDAVLLDLNLPDSRGLSTLEAVLAADRRVAIVVLTGIDDARQAQDAVRLGAQDWLTKGQPDPDLVLRALRYAAERKRLTEGLIQSQKLEAVGHLARNVAHEFNNLLTTIIGNAGLAASTDDGPVRTRALDEVTHAAKRGALLTRQLLGLARPSTAASTVADVREAILTVHRLCVAVLPRTVSIHLDVPDTASISLAQAQLEQVLLNLVLNARDALPRGGTITMAARRVPNSVVQIRIHDTGTGIHPDALPRVFEPFFTTKGDSGTGLGLMIAKELVENGGGTIRIESDYGTGTTILMDFPESTSAPDA